MSLIEQAAKRLEQLRRAGVEAEDPTSRPDPRGADPREGTEHVPTPEAAMRELGARASSAAAAVDVPMVVAPTTVSGIGATADTVATAAAAAPASEGRRAPLAASVRPRAAPEVASAQPSAAGVVTPEPRPARVDINLARLKAMGFVTPDAPQSQIADEFRVIKRPIIRNAQGGSGANIRNGNLVMVTSALPSEGKTFTALNLAISIAMEMDSTVLLVDGDVSHPELPNLLGIPKAPGLLDLLTRNDLDVADALVRTNIEKLSVLPAGSHHRRATELLASEQMVNLLREFASRYSDRIIVFDSPPLLAATEARVLASHMGQILMVVAADSTSRRAVDLALGTIESCENVLMMLNKAEKTDIGTYYGYYADAGHR